MVNSLLENLDLESYEKLIQTLFEELKIEK